MESDADIGVEIILVGNKIDITNREVSLEDGIKLAEKFGVPIVETSALTGVGIETAFLTLVQNIHSKEFKNIILTDPGEKKVNKKTRCCG